VPPPFTALSLAEIEAKQDPTIRLQQLVSQGEYEEAFTMALSLSHVETVVWLCQLADLRSVLQKPCKLSQSVLLSLVQQLGSDLGNRGGGMQEKLDWIQDLALLLDTSDPVLAPHMGPILSQLLTNLKAAEAVAPREDSSAFRIVTHIVKSLLTTCQ
jgi:enhancer of mRNA-decapping protein 4